MLKLGYLKWCRLWYQITIADNGNLRGCVQISWGCFFWVVNRHLSHVIHLTTSAKNNGKTTILCRVCLKAWDFFSLVESMVFFVVDGKCYFLLLVDVGFANIELMDFACKRWLVADTFCTWLGGELSFYLSTHIMFNIRFVRFFWFVSFVIKVVYPCKTG
jgi:hypothetical protein